MKKLHLILALGFAFLIGCATSPSHLDASLFRARADGCYALLSEGQLDYLSRPMAERRELFADADFRKKKMGHPRPPSAKGERKMYWPRVVRIAWGGRADATYKVFVRDVKKGDVVFTETVKGNFAEVDNLEIAASYEWRAEGGAGEVFKGTFRTSDQPPRILRFPGVPNVRDLGGRIGYKGHRIRQGLVFRSAGLNENASGEGNDLAKYKTGASRVEGEKGAYIRARFGIKTDIDLRSDEEVAGMTGSPLGPTVAWRHISSAAYGALQGKWGRGQFKKVFKVFLDRANYPIDFHCIAGQDRTGGVAFILGALLGVDENQLALDWETTGFWNRDVHFNHARFYDHLVDGFKKRYPAPTIRESVEKYVRSLGYTDADIELLRSIMLEGYETPPNVRVAVYVGPGACGTGTYRHVQIGAFARGVDEILVDDKMIREDVLKKVDVLVIPGGQSPRMSKELGAEGLEKIRSFVAAGGGYIGTCAGAVLGSTSVPGYRPNMLNLAPFASRAKIARPQANVNIRYTPAAAEILGPEFSSCQHISYAWGPIFTPTNEIPGASFQVLAKYDGEYLDQERLPMYGKDAIVAGTYGKGRVFLSAVHPEVDFADHNLLRAAFRYVSGRETSWEFPPRAKRGILSVGFSPEESMGVESMTTLQKLLRLDRYDVMPVGGPALAEGDYDWIDVMVVPTADNIDNPSSGLGYNLARTKKFLAQGGRIIVWGSSAKDYQALGDGVRVVQNGDEAIRVLDEIDRATKPIEVAFYTEGAGACDELAGILARTPGFHVRIVTGRDIRAGILQKADLLVMPGGSSKGEYESLGAEGAAEIVRFVRRGGSYYGICAGAFLASQTVREDEPRLGLVPWKDPSAVYPGFGDVELALTDAGRAILGVPETSKVLYWGGPVFEPGEPVEDSDIQVLATYKWHILSTVTPNARRPMDGKPALLAGRVGKGKVYLQAPHPEMREESFDYVRAALKYLTGRDVTGTLPRYSRGQLVVGCEAPRSTAFANFYLKLLGYHNVFYRNIRYGYPENDMQRLDVLIIANPTARVLMRESIRSFIQSGRLVFVVAETDEERAACQGVPGLAIVRSYDALLKHFEK